jgi:transcriptional regulator with XRE-family HTH domain
MASKHITRIAHTQIEKAGGEDYVFSRVGNGETLTAIAKDLGVSRPLLSEWVNSAPRRDGYTLAKRLAASALAEQGLNIVDAASDPTEVPAAKLQSDYRRWMASRLSSEWAEQRSPAIAIQINGLHLDALRQRSLMNRDEDDE